MCVGATVNICRGGSVRLMRVRPRYRGDAVEGQSKLGERGLPRHGRTTSVVCDATANKVQEPMDLFLFAKIVQSQDLQRWFIG